MNVLEKIDSFFQKEGSVHDTLRRVVRTLEDAGIGYAVFGGMAMFAHGFLRYTERVEILTTPAGLDAIHEQFVGREFEPRFPGARKALRDTSTGVEVQFVTAEEHPISTFVEIDGMRVIALDKLIDLKLAAGLKNPQRLRDLADVHDLIAYLDLPLELAEKLDPSVRDTYVEYWHIHQNPIGPDRE